MHRRVSKPGPPSVRLASLIEGDLPNHRREGQGNSVRFVPNGTGPVIDLTSRIEKKFLGRTEIAVFGSHVDVFSSGESIIALKHTGGLKRTGISAHVVEGGEFGERLAAAMTSDKELREALMPLDFTRFEIYCDPRSSRVEVELVGASHVAIALPPMRSYVRLYPDQREALASGIERAFEVIATLS